jgi:hypothetical protein
MWTQLTNWWHGSRMFFSFTISITSGPHGYQVGSQAGISASKPRLCRLDQIAGLNHSPCMSLLESFTSSKIESIELLQTYIVQGGPDGVTSGPAIVTFRRRGFAAALWTVDPIHGFVFAIARRQRGDHARRSIHDVIMRARCVVDAVAATSCSTTLEANDLRKQSRVFEQIDHSRVNLRQQVSIEV